MNPIPTPTDFGTHYGPYGFGVLAFALIVGVLLIVWRMAVMPALVQLAAIAKHQADTAQAMKDTTEAAKDTTQTAERIMASCTCRKQTA